MPPPETFERNQYAVLWALSSWDDYGRQTVAEPVEIRVRWNTGKREATRADGSPVSLDATVVVLNPVAIGSLLWLGRLSEWYGTGSGGDESEVMVATTYHNTPDLKNRFNRREIGLVRWKDTLPTVVS